MRIIFAGCFALLMAVLSACQGTQKETPAAASKEPASVKHVETTQCDRESLTFQQALKKIQENTVTDEDGAKFMNARQALDECNALHKTENSGAAPDLKQVLSEGGVKSATP